MNIRELLKRDFGLEVRISAGNGRRDNPYVLQSCGAEDAALTQVQLLRGIGRGRGELWRIVEWIPSEDGFATEVIRVEAIRFTETEIETSTRDVYFDTRAASGSPHSIHPLAVWRGPPGTPILPYELGWLHFERTVNNASSVEVFDQTIFYKGSGAKLTVYVYARPFADAEGIREAELKLASEAIQYPELTDPWPVSELGPFAMKYFLSGSDLTAIGIAVSNQYFVKARLTCFDNIKMRGLMNYTLNALGNCVLHGTAVKH